jgi:hypothetical protein
MTMTFLNNCIVLIMAAASSWQFAASQPAYDCAYSAPISIHPDEIVWLEHYQNPAEKTFSMRVTYTDGDDSWVGIGINYARPEYMTPSYVVIGDATRGVNLFWLGSDSTDASGVYNLGTSQGQLKNGTFVQENGQSILEFTLDLTILNDDNYEEEMFTIDETSDWIFAVGLPGNQWAGHHQVDGSFTGLSLLNSCKAVQAPTPAPAVTGNGGNQPVQAQTSAPAVAGNGGTASTGTTGQGTVEPNQTEQPQQEEDSPAFSTTESSNSQLVFGAASDKSATRGLWVSHGILLGLAWGVFVPLAIGAAYLKKMQILQKDALWLTVHFYCTVTAVIFTIVGFAVAVIATQKEGDLPHFADEVHRKAGLAIFILVIVQAAAGYFRPPANKATKSPMAAKDASATTMNNVAMNDTLDGMDMSIPDDASTAEAEENEKSHSSSFSYVRQYWEYFHRFLGITLLGLAWYNCQTGIILQSDNYPEQDDKEQLLDIFWGITGTIAGAIFVMGYVIRIE